MSATNRVTQLEAAVDADGRVRALTYDQIEDVGAHIRAPEPATLYRMHGNLTGAYDIRHVAVRNRVVLTNKTPTGLNRGFGGPQMYYALERLMQRVAIELKLDPIDVIRRNLVPTNAFPYRTATGALLDSGDYSHALDVALADGGFAELKKRRDAARAQGRIYGIGCTAVVEPSVSNMGYITTVLTADERRRAGAKNGAQATATVAFDPLGGVSVHAASAPQGQGHRTVLAQIVADAFGLASDDIRVVSEIDTARDAWSIASGNYSSRFAAAVGGAAHLAATRLKEKLARTAAAQLNVPPAEIEFAGGRVRARGNPDNSIPFARLAADQPLVAGYGGRRTIRRCARPCSGRRRSSPRRPKPTKSIRRSATDSFSTSAESRSIASPARCASTNMSPCTTADAFCIPAWLRARSPAASRRRSAPRSTKNLPTRRTAAFLAGTFADYLLPTTTEVPAPIILHVETPSPFTPLGAKGVGEGNCMSTPVCLANAVADALGIAAIDLPMTPAKLAAHIHPTERAPGRVRGRS